MKEIKRLFYEGIISLGSISKYRSVGLAIGLYIIGIILFLAIYNSLLKKQVRKRTIDLEGANKELVDQQKEIYNLAYYDTITSLPNRIKFIKEVDKLLDNLKAGQIFAVLFLDLDNFKNINSSLGHDTGDYILKLLSQRLQKIMGKNDVLAKVGGDEYFILHGNMKNREDVIQLANKVINKVSESLYIEGYELYLTTSIGIAIYPEGGLDSGSLIKNSDLALYKAKEMGRNSYYIYGEELKPQGFNKMLLLNELRKAVEEDQLVAYYQPQIEIKTGEIIGVEALVRWEHPEKGFVYPDEFISLSEETGLIIPIGQWILKKACIDARKWIDKGKDLYVSVNVSGSQFKSKNFIEEVKEILKTLNFNPKNLVLEITETIAVSDMRHTISVLNKLKKMGVLVSIDDFGTGYSSLNYLSEMAVNELKIDKSFIGDIEKNKKNKMISNTIIVLAKELGLKVTAEGVENSKQLDILRDMDCDFAQGYYFSKAVTKEEIDKLIL